MAARVIPRRRRSQVAAAIVVGVVGYLLVTLAQVVAAAHVHQHGPAQAIVVLGAAQYDGRPSPDLAARLRQALQLWRAGAAPLVVLTGGREPGDTYTEAATGDGWMEAHGVPDRDLLTVVQGRDTWRSLTATAAVLEPARRSVILVSDPFHDLRIELMASTLGLRAEVSPTTTSPIRGTATFPYYLKETAEVAVARVIGFRRLAELVGS